MNNQQNKVIAYYRHCYIAYKAKPMRIQLAEFVDNDFMARGFEHAVYMAVTR